MVVPLTKGAKAVRLQFEMLDDLDPVEIPIVAKSEPNLLNVEIPTADGLKNNVTKGDDLSAAVSSGRAS